MKKSEFIKDFLEAVWDFSKNLPKAFIREPWHYKDLRIGGHDPNKLYDNFYNLKSRGILKYSGSGHFSFTSKGSDWALKSANIYFRKKEKTWDKKWRLVIFDIPEELHYARIRFRRKLKALGFYMLQKSVFIFPYKCEEELSYICEDLGVSDYVDLLIANNAGFRQEELLEFYNL